MTPQQQFAQRVEAERQRLRDRARAVHAPDLPPSMSAPNRCGFCGRRCRGAACTYHRDLPALEQA